MSALVLATYNGQQVAFTDDGWFNATEAAAKFGKRPVDWLKLESTKSYMEALRQLLPEVKKFHFAQKGGSDGGGTWLHPKLAVPFARWLDDKFAIWCDVQIDALIHGKQDWRKLRHEAASSYKVMQQILQMSRSDDGKTCAPHHFSNEARLVNFALTGEFKGANREAMDSNELTLLAKLEERNAVLIGRGLQYDKRKVLLEQFAVDHRFAAVQRLERAA